jgi:hypothetical protein
MKKDAFDTYFMDTPEEEEEELDTLVSEEEVVVPSSTEDDAFDTYFMDTTEEEITAPIKEETASAIIEEKDDAFDTYFMDADEPAEQDNELEDFTTPRSFEEFSKDRGYMESIEEYSVGRYGKEGAQQEDETDEEYLERFLTHVRGFETNSISLLSTLDWVRGASEEEKNNFAYAYSQLERMPGFLDEGGGDTLRGFRDYVGYFIVDPLNLIGFGAGKVAATGAQRAIIQVLKTQGKKAAEKQALKLTAKAAAKPAAFEVAVDFTGGTLESMGRQEVDDELDLIDEVDVGLAAMTGGVMAVAGGGLTALATGLFAKKGAARIIKESEDAAKLAGERAAARETARQMDTDYVFDPVNGHEILDEIDLQLLRDQVKGGELTESQLQVEISQRIAKIATETVADMMRKGNMAPEIESMIANNAKASEIARVVLSSENIDSSVLDGAIARAGMSTKDFLDVSGVSLSDAARTMSSYSDLGKLIKRVNELDPAIAKEIDDKFGKENATTSVFGKAHDLMMRLDRERRAFMVSQIATTARNVATAGMRLGMESGAKFMESSLYHLGKGIGAVARGEASIEGFQKGLRELGQDTFGTLSYLSDYSGSKELSESLLKYNPRLARIMDRSLQEVDVDQSLSRGARLVNTLNILQDGYFRRAVFNDSVAKQLRGAGMDVDDFVGTGKGLPTSILERAVDDALSFTFARMPKVGGDRTGDTIGHYFVKMNEALGPLPGVVGAPVGTGAFPFARFMVNAMQFQFDYSPLSTVGAITNGSKGIFSKYVKGISDIVEVDGKSVNIKEILTNKSKYTDETVQRAEALSKKTIDTERQLAKAREQIGKATVGTAALFAAIKHREENQDTEWYNVMDSEGRTLDTRPFFPISPYLAVADFIVKMKNDTLDEAGIKQVMEGLTGSQIRAGASAYMIDSFFENLESVTGGEGGDIKTEKMAEYVGGYLGELVGAVTTPARVVGDIMAQFDKEALHQRDARQIDGVGGFERGVSAFENSITRNLPKIPGLFDEETSLIGVSSSQDMPIKESASRERPEMKQSPLLAQLTGVRFRSRRSPVEKKLLDLGYEEWEIVPTTGDKTADAFVKKHMGMLVERYLSQEINSESFNELTDAQQKASVANKLKRYRKLAKEMGKAESFDGEKGFTAFDRAEWSKLSSKARRLADEYYQDRYNMSVLEKQNKDPDTNHFLIGKKVGNALNTAFK